ncbi:Leucine-rich repeat receptor-like protein kinase [Corchorus olitorius]|uniref:Leucine-rich repeat receptor-like protein kinase n=1 Tax=Corchorus olitorius TaxID=93759 RepID=A0A1R3KPL6_9ROSI|nr:Leucine-rich repeat receptor-like protein kinase [Corchorus olitorius]
MTKSPKVYFGLEKGARSSRKVKASRQFQKPQHIVDRTQNMVNKGQLIPHHTLVCYEEYTMRNIDLTMRCLAHDSQDRPTIEHILKELQEFK